MLDGEQQAGGRWCLTGSTRPGQTVLDGEQQVGVRQGARCRLATGTGRDVEQTGHRASNLDSERTRMTDGVDTGTGRRRRAGSTVSRVSIGCVAR
jgi:hypothetical protein